MEEVKYLGIKVDVRANPKEFRDRLKEAMDSRPFDALQLDVFDLDFYESIIKDGGNLILSEDGCFGAYVSNDGEIGSLFRHRKSKTVRSAAFVLSLCAKLGGRYFNAYGTNQLENLYVNNKFNPVARVRFDESVAPKGWQHSSIRNKPDVVFFAYSPKGIYNVGGGIYCKEWDDANEIAKRFSKNVYAL